MSTAPAASFFGDKGTIDAIYGMGRRERIAGLTRLHPEVITLENFDRHADALGETEVIFSTWGMPLLSGKHLDRMPRLKAVFYAAGTVRQFAGPLMERGIALVSAWQANAVPVAEFTLAQILLSTKGYFQNLSIYKSSSGRRNFSGNGNFGEKVALLGAGAIGRKVIEMLRRHTLRILVFDPFLSEERASQLGVEKVSLEAAFAEGCVISNHLANVPETRGMLGRRLFETMRRDATFINTGRGATVDEEGMLTVLRARPDLTALIDVTIVEPPPEGSPFYTLPNLHLSSHIAGSIGDERVRLADYCIEEFLAWRSGEPLRYAVTPRMMETMA
ncbi:MAG TPA: hydroxyacid dehydrogenase [Chthoniobacteraceae bacterium]|nr:hydroxyacid dehydrogenase [Chthoniobacteraceae bacterium]